MGRSAAEQNLSTKEEILSNSASYRATTDRGRDSIRDTQGGDRQDTVANNGASALDLPGDLATGG